MDGSCLWEEWNVGYEVSELNGLWCVRLAGRRGAFVEDEWCRSWVAFEIGVGYFC